MDNFIRDRHMNPMAWTGPRISAPRGLRNSIEDLHLTARHRYTAHRGMRFNSKDIQKFMLAEKMTWSVRPKGDHGSSSSLSLVMQRTRRRAFQGWEIYRCEAVILGQRNQGRRNRNPGVPGSERGVKTELYTNLAPL